MKLKFNIVFELDGVDPTLAKIEKIGEEIVAVLESNYTFGTAEITDTSELEYINHYHCEKCDDECPECGQAISPVETDIEVRNSF